MRVKSSARDKAVQPVVALERVVDAEALREIVPRAQLVGEVAHQLQQRRRQIAIDGHWRSQFIHIAAAKRTGIRRRPKPRLNSPKRPAIGVPQ